MNIEVFSGAGLLIAAAFLLAGFFDAVCGGGGLITVPTMLMTGVPATYVVGTNMGGSALGAATSFAKYAKSGKIDFKSGIPAAVCAMVGSSLGARFNIYLPEEILEKVLLVLIPVIFIVLLLNRDFGKENHMDELSGRSLMIRGALIGFFIGAYQGFYGGGAGTFFIIAFCVAARMDVLMASGNAKFISICSFTSAAITYAMSGAMVFNLIPVLTICNMVGNYLGAAIALKKGARFVRPMFYIVFTMLFIKLLLDVLGIG